MKLLERFGFARKQHREEPSAPLYLFNTLSGKKEEFVPLGGRLVKMYNCGPTVYDYQHIGNLRPYVAWDVLKRTLWYNGCAVRQVINITDVGHLTGDNEGNADVGEDKMSAGLRREGKELTLRNMRKLGEKYTKVFLDDLAKLNIKTDKTVFPRASDYIGEQIALTQTLDEKGYAYELGDGVYFDTSRFANYGMLGSVDTQQQREGARVRVHKQKRNPADFAIWKKNGGIGWDSPWGKGFPGWHLECTAMIFAELGKQIDIHTGGIDHIAIHHNNEIAQAEAATGKAYVKYWLHNAFITIEGQKIAKSVGNTIYLRNLTDREFNPLAYRYWLLTAHYRTPVNFTWDALEGAQTTLTRLHRFFIEDLPAGALRRSFSGASRQGLGEKSGTVSEPFRTRFHQAINDDLDTPKAVAILWELVHDEGTEGRDKRATLLNFDKVLGLGLIEGNKRLRKLLNETQRRVSVQNVPKAVQKLLDQREVARTSEDWDTADALRSHIEEKGYLVEDTSEGPKLKKK